MKIHKHIGLFYIVSSLCLAILVIFGVFYLERSRDQAQYVDIVENTHRVLSTINFCERKLIEAEDTQRGYILTAESNYKENFEAILPEIDSSLNKLRILSFNNFGQKIYFSQLKKFVDARLDVLKENIMLSKNDPEFFNKLRNGLVLMDNCKLYMAKMRQVEEGLLLERLQKKNKFQQLNLSYLKTTLIVACLICIIALGIFFRELGIRLAAQKNLKNKINELSNRKHELEEITFAASHDLQEPMRKVRILTSLITKKFTDKIPEEALEVINRINKVTEQMYELLNELVLYTNLLNPIETTEVVNLYTVFKAAYNKIFSHENVQFQLYGVLPMINGSYQQLETMLIHLFDNSLKFKSPERELRIVVQYEFRKIKESNKLWNFSPNKEFHVITISDNGIGFDELYNEKIFGLFQRLHNHADYPGKGVGLSVAKRVMSNHNGFIKSIGQTQTGASFILYFPAG